MRLERIKFYTHRLEALWAFYTEKLGLSGQWLGRQAFSLEAGATELAFEARETEAYYHFAFNIPSFQQEEALAWLKEKGVGILRDGATELIDFSNWEAYAMYFFDPAGNIVEFIARRGLDYRTEEPFSAASILSVSEAGLPVAAVKPAFELLNQQAGVPFYSGNFDTFCAAGNPEGLFILVDPEQKQWFPTEKQALSHPLELVFTEKGSRHKLLLRQERLQLD